MTNLPVKKEISIAWKNVQYEVIKLSGLIGSGKSKTILRQLNGNFECNSLNGLMGPSGAGKTTLLNALNGNVKNGLTEQGEIYLNCSTVASKCFSYFISQHVHESIVGRMRVQDILRYAFKFKNNGENQQMDKHISSTIEQLMLSQDVMNRNFDQCSGGEQKRIAIAQELMSLQKPSFLFIDEPTTGLDSSAALEVMKCLKQLTVSHNITVIASIHVPNSEILNMFDKLYVLAKGGVAIYSGAPDKIESHLKEQINLQNIPEGEPPIETLIKIACEPTNSNINKLANLVRITERQHINAHSTKLKLQTFAQSNQSKCFSFKDLLLQICRLFSITFICEYRQRIMQMLLYISMILILGSFFSRDMIEPTGCESINVTKNCNLDFEKTRLLNENFNYLCISMHIFGFLLMIGSLLDSVPMMKVLKNEHRNKWYSIGTFFWSSSSIKLLQMTLSTLIVALVSYYFSGQHASDHYHTNWTRLFHYIFCLWLTALYCDSISQLVATLFANSFENAIIVLVGSYLIVMDTSDIFFKTDEIQLWPIVKLTELTAWKYTTRYVVYVFYGIDRCDEEMEVSSMMAQHYVRPNQIQFYIARILINAALVRLFTFLVLLCRFNRFELRWIKKIVNQFKLTNSKAKPNQSYDNESTVVAVYDVNRNIEPNNEKSDSALKDKVSIAWRHLNLFGSSSIYENKHDNNNNRVEILRDLNGQFCFGTLNALMGSSGAGKTSLLKVLNGRSKTRLDESTNFFLSNQTSISTCFITQEVSGHLIDGLTVKQMLVYASRLKNSSENNVDHEKIALKVLSQLDLLDTIDTKVDKCSGGERKRLALAAELTQTVMPNLICIDEPTSGLDSNSAETVISCLARLAKLNNLTIIASVHQPNMSLLSLFDQLYVLARGGVCIYSGPPNRVQSCIAKIEPKQSRFYLETLIDYSRYDHHHQTVQQLVELNLQHFNLLGIPKDTVSSSGVIRNRQRFTLHSVYILTLRHLSYFRAHQWKEILFFSLVSLFVLKFLQICFNSSSTIAQVSGCMNVDDDFTEMCTNRSVEIQSDMKQVLYNVSYNFSAQVLILAMLCIQTGLNFYKSINHFMNEHRNGWYSAGSFYLMKCFTDLVPNIPLIFLYVYVWDIYEDVRPGIYWNIVLLLSLNIAATLALVDINFVLANGNISLIFMLIIGQQLLFGLISNFFIAYTRLHYVYQFVSNFAPMRFSFEGLMLLQYGFGRCGPRQLHPILLTMSLEDADYVRCVLMIGFNLVLYRLIAVLLLVRKINPIENRRQRVERINDFVHKLKSPSKIISGL